MTWSILKPTLLFDDNFECEDLDAIVRFAVGNRKTIPPVTLKLKKAWKEAPDVIRISANANRSLVLSDRAHEALSSAFPREFTSAEITIVSRRTRLSYWVVQMGGSVEYEDAFFYRDKPVPRGSEMLAHKWVIRRSALKSVNLIRVGRGFRVEFVASGALRNVAEQARLVGVEFNERFSPSKEPAPARKKPARSESVGELFLFGTILDLGHDEFRLKRNADVRPVEDFISGRRKSCPPLDVKIEKTKQGPSDFPCFHVHQGLVFSDKARKALQAEFGDEFKCKGLKLPAKYEAAHGKYWMVQLNTEAESLDWGYEKPAPAGYVLFSYGGWIIARESDLAGHHMIRVSYMVIVSERFRQVVKEAGLVGGGVALIESTKKKSTRRTKASRTTQRKPRAQSTKKKPGKKRAARGKKSEGPADVKKLVESVDFELPANYIDYLKNYPDDVRKTTSGAGESIADLDLLENVDEILTLNEAVREYPDEITWPENYFAIGRDGGGNYFAIDRTKKNSPVYFYSHEEDEWGKWSNTIKAFGKKCIKQYKQWDL